MVTAIVWTWTRARSERQCRPLDHEIFPLEKRPINLDVESQSNRRTLEQHASPTCSREIGSENIRQRNYLAARKAGLASFGLLRKFSKSNELLEISRNELNERCVLNTREKSVSPESARYSSRQVCPTLGSQPRPDSVLFEKLKGVYLEKQIFSLALGFRFIESSKSLRYEIISFIVLYEIETTRIRAVFPTDANPNTRSTSIKSSSFAHWHERAPLKHPKKPLTSDNENLTVEYILRAEIKPIKEIRKALIIRDETKIQRGGKGGKSTVEQRGCPRKCLLFGLCDIKDSMCTNDAIGMDQAETMVYLLGSIFLILVRASYIRGGADRIDELH
ncbi:hypothetical protein HZH66_009057 [Vespula vulgaris]|uniref:Uncharacterized protein n=1 Tax=Vespula vulgaris TaxID=7454 RepID=A0A834JUI4_VESVU|nr:hypothetical protein HZH66_009057 [Vespula vulgaris]